uniref:HDC08755 n=1 Tax=Drosophila melanogaster TaxID=7227 RepID=Q6ILQ7_DROME|nr:TPA_inf: HDC08755 [Drosophila melanogaster]
MTALQGVPLEFLPEQLLAIIWSAARAVSPGITALPLEKRTSPVGLGLGLRLGTGTHSSAIVGPASTCDYYHQFCAGRLVVLVFFFCSSTQLKLMAILRRLGQYC